MRIDLRRCAAALALLTSAASAQTTPLRGVAYDSVRNRPLGGAFITLDNGRSTEADGSGHFRFDSVAAGEHVVSMQHASLDSIGFTGLAVRTRLRGAADEMRIATPSFASMWGVACRTKRPPKDSGFVYGTVIDAETRKPIAGALVGVTWLALSVAKGKDVSMQQFAGAARTNADGGYAICGVPVGLGLRMQANVDSVDSGVIDMLATDLPVQRRDFAISRAAASAASRDASRNGVIAGRVTATGGAPIANARILVDDDTTERRTDAQGAFTIRDVAPGSHQVEAFSIGMSPKASVVDVAPGDTARFGVQLDRVQTLDVIRVTSSAGGRRRALEVYERQRVGLGYFRDSSRINPHGPTANVFDLFPATQVERLSGSRFRLYMKDATGHWCSAQLFLDGALVAQDWLDSLVADDIAVVEVYPRGTNVPVEFASRSARALPCGAAAIWTKRAFK